MKHASTTNRMHPSLSRRVLLGGMSAATVGAFGLAGCSTDPGAGSPDGDGGTTGNTTATIPTFQDSGVVEPELVTEFPGGANVYAHYPKEQQAATDGPPLNGETVTALTYTYQPTAPGLNDNPLWQAVNSAIGGQIDIIWSHAQEYSQKLATTTAGGDIPDFVSILGAVQRLPSMLEAEFSDLTEYLAGDAVLDYPNLAATPPDAWREAMINGKVWGVPIWRAPISNVMFVREDMVGDKGLNSQPESFAEFKELLTALTDERNSQWGCSAPDQVVTLLCGAMGTSAGWTEEGGTFTNGVETEQYEQALADTRALVDAGLFHPDSVGSNNNQRNTWYQQGVVPTVYAGFGGWPRFAGWATDEDYELSTMKVFSYDGSAEPLHGRTNMSLSYTVIKKSDPERVKLLLKVLDWMAAPFGSSENLVKAYGVEGETYTLEGTDPVMTEEGAVMRQVPLGYISRAPLTYYDPTSPAAAEDRFNYQEEAMPITPDDPTLGLYSETDINSRAQLNQILDDARDGILSGRAEVSTWQAAVDEWRSTGGDQVREEYQTAFAESQ